MALREILHDGDPVLRKKSKRVARIDNYIHRLLDDMLETLHKADGVGLAAPQIGVLRRVVIIEVDDVLYELINPEITQTEGSLSEIEACLSVPGRAGIVERPQKVTVTALDRNGETRVHTGEGLLARAFCHEIDHLDGRLYTDIMTEEVDLDAMDDEDGEDDDAPSDVHTEGMA
jgi:peptide deformylase